MSSALQIVVFDNPFPPSYGGVVDVFYKIKRLNERKVDIYLHYFDDSGKKPQELIDNCKAIYVYPRRYSLFTYMSMVPFVVKSRANSKLLKNLEAIGHPVFYEGLNTCYSLQKISSRGLSTFVRLHNIEHEYYKNLGRIESNILKKIFYYIESYRLMLFEKKLVSADCLFAIAPHDYNYFKGVFNCVKYLPVFQSKTELLKTEDRLFCLFHGDLRLSDNIKSANFLLDFFSKHTVCDLVIASSFENKAIINRIDQIANIKYHKILSLGDMEELFKKTSLHILMSFQSSGIKLKLLNALFTDAHVIANNYVVEGSGLESSCHIFESEKDLRNLIKRYFGKPLTNETLVKRKKQLEAFDTKASVNTILEILEN